MFMCAEIGENSGRDAAKLFSCSAPGQGILSGNLPWAKHARRIRITRDHTIPTFIEEKQIRHSEHGREEMKTPGAPVQRHIPPTVLRRRTIARMGIIAPRLPDVQTALVERLVAVGQAK